jgi:hypothetical protein
LELVAATTVIAMALVPALRIMRDTVRIGQETEMANLLATFSASKMEEHLVLTAVSWSTTTAAGNFGTEGFQVIRSDATAAGGIPGSLMSVTSTVWEDENSNDQWDQGEPRVVFGSKLARSVAYEEVASG